MSFQTEQQETADRELKVTVRVEEDRVQEAVRRTASKYGKKLRIPGFRPGKAPFHIIQNWVGKEALRIEAVESLTEVIYQEVLEQLNVEPFAPGSVDDIEVDPLVYHLTVPLRPVVELAGYRDVRVDPPSVEVTDEAVNEAMQAIQEKHALLEPVGRPCQQGDVVIADFRAEQNGETLIEREKAELLLDPARLYPDTPFVENVAGMAADEERRFEVNVAPADQEPQVATYTVRVHEVKSRYVPPLTDALAKEEGHETLLDLRIDTRRKLTEAAQAEADARYADQVFDRMREGAKVTYAPAAVEQEIDRRVQEMEQRFSQQHWSLDDYLKTQGKTRETLREQLRPDAQSYLERSQVTMALVEAERLRLAEGEIDQLVDQRLGEMSKLSEETANQLRETYSTAQARAWLANGAMMDKFTERLRAIGRGEAPELPVLADEEE